MTPDITDQDEREAIEYISNGIREADKGNWVLVAVEVDKLRALLQRATRAHD